MNVPVERLCLDKHPFATLSSRMREVLLPLTRSYGIVHFSFERLYPKHESTIITTNPEFAKLFFDNKFYLNAFADDLSQYKYCNFLWDAAPENEIIQACAQHSHQGHGLSLIRPRRKYCDFFFFATKLGNSGINHLYVNQLNIFEKFIDFFLVTAKDLILEAEANCYTFPTNSRETLVSNTYPYIGESSNLNQINTELKRPLTVRELECARYMRKGLNAKQIARYMNISYRTVQKHLENIKKKLGLGYNRLHPLLCFLQDIEK